MRDDRYSGMQLPRHLPKLFRMSWRDADRRVPGLMLTQATKVLNGLCKRELSPTLLSALKQHQSSPTLVDGYHMRNLTLVDRLGSEIAGLIEDNPGISSRDAVRMALLARAEYYAWEQRLCHDIEREAIPASVSDNVRHSLRDAAAAVVNGLFSDRRTAHVRVPFSIDENLI